MCLGFILSGSHFILLHLHLALHLTVTFSVTRVLGTFSCEFPMELPVGCKAMTPLTATGAVGSSSPSLSFTVSYTSYCSVPVVPWHTKRSLLVHTTSGLNRLTAGKFVNVCLGRCTAQKHVLITTAGNVQLDT